MLGNQTIHFFQGLESLALTFSNAWKKQRSPLPILGNGAENSGHPRLSDRAAGASAETSEYWSVGVLESFLQHSSTPSLQHSSSNSRSGVSSAFRARFLLQFRCTARAALVAALLLAPLAHAGEFKLPVGVYSLQQLEAAKEQATKNGKAVAFVLSELKGKGSKAATPNTHYAFNKIKGVCVPVYVDYVDDLKGLAAKLPLVSQALNSGKAGKTVPRVAAFDPELKRVVAIISTMPEGVMGDGVYEDACKQIQDYLKDPEKQVTLDAPKKGKGKKNK